MHYSAGGHIVFGNDTELWTAPFDPVRLALAGSPVRLADDLLTFRRGGAANLAVTADGTLVYVPTSVGISSSGTLVRVDRDGSNATPVHTDLLETPRHLQLSPDGQRVVLVTGPIEQGEIWIHPLDGRPPTPLWQEGRNGFPVWMDDGTRVVFSTARGNNQMDLVWLATDGDMMEPEVLLEGREGYYPAAWVPQRNELIFGQDTQSGQTRWDLRRLTAEGEVHVVVQTRSDDTEGQISPNGRFIAYESTLNDRSEVWVRPYPDGAPTRVSSNGGDEPRWSFDGTELFYLESAGLDSGRMMVATVDTEGAFRFDTPVLLFENPYRFDQSFPYVVLPDGDFIMTRATRANAVTGDPGAESRLGDHLVVIVDLDDELARIAPPAQ